MEFIPNTFAFRYTEEQLRHAQELQQQARTVAERAVAAETLKNIRDVMRGDAGEKMVYDALSRIDDNWVVCHSFRLFGNPYGEKLYNRELDFLILIPRYGIIALEVKNYMADSPHLDDAKENTPSKQAQTAMQQLVDWMKANRLPGCFTKNQKTGRWDAVFEYTSAAIMVDASTMQQRNDSKYLCGFQHRNAEELKEFILKQFEKPRLTKDCFEQLKDFLFRPGIYKVSMEQYHEIMLRSTAVVNRILPMLECCKDGINVTGCAGSGKTVMALTEACRLTDAGKKVLYLCYNKNLGIWLNHDAMVQERKTASLTISHFHRFIGGLLGRDFYQDSLTDIEWKTIVSAIETNSAYWYDYIIIDEAQDFLDSYWKIIEAIQLIPENCAKLYTFSDEDQTLRNMAKEMPRFNTRISLNINLRNSHQIGHYGRSILQNQNIELLPLKAQEVTIEEPIANPAARARRIRQIRNKILNQNPIAYNVRSQEIAVLSPWKTDNPKCSFSYASDILEAPDGKGGYEASLKRYESTLFNLDATKVLAETVKGFKGLEAGYIILTDMPAPSEELETGFSLSDFYVACSRAKIGLYIIPIDEAAAKAARAYLPQN